MIRSECGILLIAMLPAALCADESDDTLRFYLSKAKLVIACEVLDQPAGLVTEAGVTNYICQVRVLSVLHGASDEEKLRVNIVRFDGTGEIPKRNGKYILFLQNVAPDAPAWETADFWFGIMDYHERTAAASKRVAEQIAKQPAKLDPSCPGEQPDDAVAAKNETVEDHRADAACDELLAAREYGALLRLLKQWKQHETEPLQKEIVIRLMRDLGSTEPTPLKDNDGVVIMWRLPSDEKRPTPDNRDWTWQDLWIKGGRCAWALERLLEYDLPPIKESMTADERRTAVLDAQARIVRAMQMPLTFNATALPEAERIKVAQSERTHPRVLEALSGDSSVAVRRAVASNRFTPPQVLTQKLYHDPDPEVVERAKKNFILITPPARPR